MPTVRIPNNWHPREYQQGLWSYLEGGGRRAYEVAHRRWGKDDVALHWAAAAAHQRVGTYWHMLPEAAQARKAVWEAVNPHTGKTRIDEAFPREVRETTRGNEMFIKFKCGSTWQVVGSDNYNSLVGAPPVGLVLSEWALADPNAWLYLQPILEENGGWALFITTPRGRNHAASLFESSKGRENWWVERQTAEETGVFTAEQLKRIREEYRDSFGDDGESRFMQEYYCSFDAGVMGAYYAQQMIAAEEAKRIGKVPWEPNLEVHTAWDLGIGDSTAIWFAQRTGNETRIIDYYEASGAALSHYAKVLKEKPYIYGRHFLPHDAEVRELGTGQSRREMLAGLGISVDVLKASKVEDGIEAVRNLIPQCWFDEEKCRQGIEALRQYRREFDDKLKAFKLRPLHDWTSHAADAFRYLAMGLPKAAGWSGASEDIDEGGIL